MRNDIYVLGCGGFSKEVLLLIDAIGTYNFKGFIDYDPSESELFIGQKSFPVISEKDFLQKYPSTSNIMLAIGVGDPKLINKLSEKFKDYTFPNLIHPGAELNLHYNSIGRGNVITSNVVFTVNIEIGNFNVFNLSSTIGHDSRIGNYNVINPSVNISGGVEIGNQNLLGVGSIVLQYKKIGNETTVGAGSLVTKNVEDNTIVIGVPAKAK